MRSRRGSELSRGRRKTRTVLPTAERAFRDHRRDPGGDTRSSSRWSRSASPGLSWWASRGTSGREREDRRNRHTRPPRTPRPARPFGPRRLRRCTRQGHCPSLSLLDGPKPQRPLMPCRNRSCSPGVICSQRSAMRRRIREREPPPWRPNPPKRIRESARIPTACQKGICCQPKSGGGSQFHSSYTTSPPIAIKSSIPRIASGAIQINFFSFGLMFLPSFDGNDEGFVALSNSQRYTPVDPPFWSSVVALPLALLARKPAS